MHRAATPAPPLTGRAAPLLLHLAARLRPLGFWVRRYLPSELAGTALLLAAGTAVLQTTGSPLRAALAATAAENVGFYGVAVGQVVAEQRRAGARGWPLALRSLRLAAAEYGPAEAADAVVRPTLIWLAALAVPQAVVALLLGKVVADTSFYGIAALAHRVTVALGWRQRAQQPLGLVVDVVDLTAAGQDDDGGDDGGLPAQRRRGLAAHAGGAVGRGDRLVWANPVATGAERAAAAAQGVRLFVVDNEVELLKLGALPLGCRALVRLAHSDPRAAVDLSGKFGAVPATARRLVATAVGHGLPVAGPSYHVGSQMDAVEPFVTALTSTIALVEEVEARHGIRLDVLDIGGGFPASYDSPATPLARITGALRPVLAALDDRMTVIAEPGRAVVAEAGTAVTRVVSVAERPDEAWAYLDDGLYGSWSNVLTEHVRPLVLAAPEIAGAPLAGPVTIAGPTCCGLDVVVRAWPMPRLQVGDVVVSPTMGACTAVTASSFNGRRPAAVVVLDGTGAATADADARAVVPSA